MIGSQGLYSNDSYSTTKGFTGNLDEIKLFPGWTTIADGTVNPYCSEASPALSKITALPSDDSAFTLTDYDDNVDLYTTGKWPGTYNAMLNKNGVPIVKAPTDLSQNRSWETVTAFTDPDNSKVAVYFNPTDVATYGHNPTQDKHTIYAKQNATVSFRVCPSAVSLAEVTSGCTNGVLFAGPFPQTKTVAGASVEVGTISLDGATYWYASGLTGSGGEGEMGTEGGGSPVPFFPWWSVPGIAVVCGYVLYRGKWVEM